MVRRGAFLLFVMGGAEIGVMDMYAYGRMSFSDWICLLVWLSN